MLKLFKRQPPAQKQAQAHAHGDAAAEDVRAQLERGLLIGGEDEAQHQYQHGRYPSAQHHHPQPDGSGVSSVYSMPAEPHAYGHAQAHCHSQHDAYAQPLDNSAQGAQDIAAAQMYEHEQYRQLGQKHQHQHQHQQQHCDADGYTNPYGATESNGLPSTDAQRPFSPDAGPGTQLRPDSPSAGAGAYESYSEQHDLAPTGHHAPKGKGANKLGYGVGTPAKLEKPKRGLFGGSAQVQTDITQKIAWLCGSPNSTVDWAHVLSLADSIRHSDDTAKEAARAIRKEFRYGEPEAQRRAIRVWAILMMNASDQFKLQVATKRFLEVVDQVATSSKTDPSVSTKMFDVLAVLAYMYQADPDLNIITRCWNKIRPKDRPANGEPLGPYSEDFNPPIEASRSARNTPQPDRRAVSPSGGALEGEHLPISADAAPNGNGRSGGGGLSRLRDVAANGAKKKPRDYSQRIVSPDEDIRKLHEECHIGRTNAAVLVDALASGGLSSPLLEEFAKKVQLSQMFLASQVDWASAQANRSRDYMNEISAIAITEGRTPPPAEETREEQLLADILSANESLMEAQLMLDDARRHQMEEEEESAIRERSRVETRLDRNALAYDPQSNAGAGSGGAMPSTSSGSGSAAAAVAPLYANGLASPGLPLEAPVAQHPRGPLPKTPQQAPSPLPQMSPAPTQAIPPPQGPPQLPPLATQAHEQAPLSSIGATMSPEPEGDDEAQMPLVPSEKALGKRRAFSDRGDAFDADVQARALADQAPVHVPVKLHEVLEQDDDLP